MKFSAALLLLLLFLGSCTFEKRLYRPGFYFEKQHDHALTERPAAPGKAMTVCAETLTPPAISDPVVVASVNKEEPATVIASTEIPPHSHTFANETLPQDTARTVNKKKHAETRTPKTKFPFSWLFAIVGAIALTIGFHYPKTRNATWIAAAILALTGISIGADNPNNADRSSNRIGIVACVLLLVAVLLATLVVLLLA